MKKNSSIILFSVFCLTSHAERRCTSNKELVVINIETSCGVGCSILVDENTSMETISDFAEYMDAITCN